MQTPSAACHGRPADRAGPGAVADRHVLRDGGRLRWRCRDRKSADAVLDTGLWRFTRHPTFRRSAAVVGIYLVALSAGAWWAFIGPLLLTSCCCGCRRRTAGEDISARRPATVCAAYQRLFPVAAAAAQAADGV
jgi:protein-S-isoprenylcysteine O-methyltransferase Ste14